MKQLRKIIIAGSEIIAYYNDNSHIAIRREDGKLKYNAAKLNKEGLAEIKRLAKDENGWHEWESDENKLIEAKRKAEYAAWAKENPVAQSRMWETEDGKFYSDGTSSVGTWFSDQDENRNL